MLPHHKHRIIQNFVLLSCTVYTEAIGFWTAPPSAAIEPAELLPHAYAGKYTVEIYLEDIKLDQSKSRSFSSQ